MKARTAAIGAVLALVATTALIVSAASSATSQQDAFLAGVVSDVGRFNDKGFNQLSLKGCKSGAKKAGGTCRALESRSTGDYVPNFARLQRDGADILISTGFLLAEATATVAKRFPDAKLTNVDYSMKAPPFANAKGKPLVKNVLGLTFQTNENSYMIGCLAGLMAKREGGNTISAVGGIKIPPVDIFIAAYRAGAKKCAPGTKTLIDYSQDFVDQAKCNELAINQLDRGSKVVFAVAGNCGLGALDAAKEAGAWGVGVDNDQAFLGPHILTSAVKRVDVAVEAAVLSVKNGTFKGATDLNFNLKNKGVAVGKISSKVPKAYITRMNALGAQILAGKIKPPKTV
ncbi:MAG: BMP family ABC transporter substrate-binding protein [Actinobacteria bacterium]|nr:BMP family ABC transporter substrate-binding protein [Actinomycetota bacterium]